MIADTSRCTVGPERGRRIFWATQPNCGLYEPCPGVECGVPGLQRQAGEGNAYTIDTAEWVRGLGINMLMTDAARQVPACAMPCGTRGGHWSDAYRGDGESAGTNIRRIAPACSVAEAIASGESELHRTFSKMVAWKVAREVRVAGRYTGHNRFSFDIQIIGESGDAVSINSTGTRLDNAWLWGTTSV